MASFAYVVHPRTAGDVARRYPLARYLPGRVLEAMLAHTGSVEIGRITGEIDPGTGIHGRAGEELEGRVIACPLTSRQIENMPRDQVTDRVLAAAHLARDRGAAVVGLGGATGAVDVVAAVAGQLQVPVTGGEAGRLWAALAAMEKLAALWGLDLDCVPAAVVGATSRAGRVIAVLLGRRVGALTLVDRPLGSVERVAAEIIQHTGLSPHVAGRLRGARPRPVVVVVAAPAAWESMQPGDISPGTVVCDLARPLAVSPALAGEDVLVVHGALVTVPGVVSLPAILGLPAGTVTAGMAEVIVRALETRRYWPAAGYGVDTISVDYMAEAARRYGFGIGGILSSGRLLDEGTIAAFGHTVSRYR